jgi:hypothetical protein
VSHVVADILRRAAELNLRDPRRKGNLLEAQGPCHALVAGDIHGNRAALGKIIAHAAVEKDPNRLLLLQEVIHGPLDPRTHQDRSVELLVRVARLKEACPDRVLFVLGNHDLAQATGSEINKDGAGVCKAFSAGVEFAYPESGGEVLHAVKEFLLSMPLAVRLPNRVLVSHSLPSPDRMQDAGPDILTRSVRPEDLRRGGAVYEWTWGRGHTPEQIDALASQLDVDFFVLGHRHTRAGWEMISRRAVTLASDHEHGCVLDLPAGAPLTAETVSDFVCPVSALGA